MPQMPQTTRKRTRKTREGGQVFQKTKKKTVTETTSKASTSQEKQQDKTKKSNRCFNCGGPHLARDCPKKEKVNAVVAHDGDSDGEAPLRVNPLQVAKCNHFSESATTSEYFDVCGD